MNLEIKRNLETAIALRVPLPQVLEILREFKRLGATRGEVQTILESLRSEAPDESTEDRVLEILDLVTGYCSTRNTIWDDEPARLS